MDGMNIANQLTLGEGFDPEITCWTQYIMGMLKHGQKGNKKGSQEKMEISVLTAGFLPKCLQPGPGQAEARSLELNVGL